jgi:uncharacterized protein (TIGR02118 family)
MDRRTSVSTAIALGLAVAGYTSPAAAQAAGGMKLTVLYGPPKSADDFERYYFGTHMPMVHAAKGGIRTETAKGVPGADGAAPAFYRIFQAWFESAAQMAAITGTAEWKKLGPDLANFASGGVTVFVSSLD